jgi:hypothetical protein
MNQRQVFSEVLQVFYYQQLILGADGREIRATSDWETLKRAGDFDPTYLHLKREQAAA